VEQASSLFVEKFLSNRNRIFYPTETGRMPVPLIPNKDNVTEYEGLANNSSKINSLRKLN
jgi:hypothetical protein